MSYVETRHGAMFYMTVGSGRPLLLIHGNTMTAASQEKLAQRFADEYQVVSVDLLGHGQSALPDNLFTRDYFTLQGQALSDLLETLFPEDTVPVFGMSAGGIAALNAYCEQPYHIAALILDGVFAQIGPEALGAHRHRRATMTPAWERYMQAQHGAERWPRLRDGLLAAMEQLEAGGAVVIPCLDSIRIPVLIFQGGRDPFCPERQSRAVADAIPRSWLIFRAEAGHIIAWQEPELFDETVRKFLHDESGS
jgi:pimeloyl-ACP methyl ester carboxylesterase